MARRGTTADFTRTQNALRKLEGRDQYAEDVEEDEGLQYH